LLSSAGGGASRKLSSGIRRAQTEKRAGELVDRVEFDAKVNETTACQEDRSEAVGKKRWPRAIQGMLVLTSDGEGWGRGLRSLVLSNPSVQGGQPFSRVRIAWWWWSLVVVVVVVVKSGQGISQPAKANKNGHGQRYGKLRIPG
jgi:hypothetical protein